MISLQNNAAVTLATNQAIGAAFADLGTDPIIVTGNLDALALLVKIDRNTATDITFQFVGSDDAAFTDTYKLLIQTPSATKVNVEPLVFELSVDADQNILLPVSLDGVVPFGKWQVKASTSTDAIVLSAKVVRKQVY